MSVYFDHAATTPPDPKVIELAHELMKTIYGNASSVHSQGRKARVVVENARKDIAALLNVKPQEIFFGASATEWLNSILYHLPKKFPLKKIITTEIEHQAILKNCLRLQEFYGIELHFIALNSFGQLDLENLEFLLQASQEKQDTLVVLAHANNEIGNLIPLKEVSKLCKTHQALFACDMVQTMGKYNIDLGVADIDFAFGSAHKFHGLKGAGIAYISSKYKIEPLLVGGGQEYGFRAGTENVISIAAAAEALNIAVSDLSKNQNHILALKQYYIERLRALNIPVRFFGTCETGGLYNLINVQFEDYDSEILTMKLDIAGFCVGSGSACNSGVNQPSHVISKLYPKNPHSLRFSFGRFNTREEIDRLFKFLPF